MTLGKEGVASTTNGGEKEKRYKDQKGHEQERANERPRPKKWLFFLFSFSDVSAAALRYCLFGYPKKYFMPSFSEEERERERERRSDWGPGERCKRLPPLSLPSEKERRTTKMSQKHFFPT